MLGLVGLVLMPFLKVNAQSKYGEDSVACVQNLSMYRDDYSKKKYDDAYPNWRSVVDNCPMASKNTFVHGPVILEHKIKQAKAAGDTASYQKFIQEHPEWIQQAHDLGMSTNVWTVNNKEVLQQMADLHVGAITTNEPLLTREVLGDNEFKK